MAKQNWAEIEKDYLESGLTYPQLAEKYGVSLAAIKKQASRKGWHNKRSGSDQKAKKVETALAELSPVEMSPENVTASPVTVIDRETENQRFNRIVDEMLDRVQDAICVVNTGDAASIKLLTAALKDLRDLKHLNRTELDIEDQRARIAKLRSDTRIVETEETGGIIFMPVMEERPQPPEEPPNEQ